MGIEEDIEQFNRFYDHAKATRNPEDSLFSFEEAVLKIDNEFVMPDKEFAGLYLGLMNIFIEFKCGGTMPPCALCEEEISGPEQLRMYDTKPYHPSCFKEIYDEISHDDLMKEFFNRVLNLEF